MFLAKHMVPLNSGVEGAINDLEPIGAKAIMFINHYDTFLPDENELNLTGEKIFSQILYQFLCYAFQENKINDTVAARLRGPRTSDSPAKDIPGPSTKD